jgi:hypothetical protein
VPAAITFRIESNAQPGDDPRWVGPVDLGLFRTDFSWTPVIPVEDNVHPRANAR